MRNEIEAAARFLTQLVSQNQPANISESQLTEFRSHLIRLLEERFNDHWFPERPQKGQGYRCIRLNGFSRPDPLIHKAASETGLDYGDLKLPVEFTLWVDPLEVSCRFGEHEGSYCTVASFETDGSVITNTISTTPKTDTMTPLRVTVSSDQMLQQENVANQMQQRSPSRSGSSHRSKLSPASSSSSLSSLSPPIRSVHPSQQFRVGCFYPNYEPQKSWYTYGSLSPPLALTVAPSYHHHHHHGPPASTKSRPSPYTGWNLTYVPTTAVRYLTNSWPAMGTMVKV